MNAVYFSSGRQKSLYILNSPQNWHHLTYMHHVHLMTGGQRGGGQCERGGEQQRLKQRRRRGGGSAMHKESDAGRISQFIKIPIVIKFFDQVEETVWENRVRCEHRFTGSS